MGGDIVLIVCGVQVAVLVTIGAVDYLGSSVLFSVDSKFKSWTIIMK